MEWQYSNALPYLLIPSFLQCFNSHSREATVVRFDGQPINETDTPVQLEMEDEDSIDVFQQQTGGLY
uniref:Rad60/SUMO-like domain-containing protein n=1 Tax=Hucho hucho TaxID=62062 RepID=A0A4W5JTL4_9TELE